MIKPLLTVEQAAVVLKSSVLEVGFILTRFGPRDFHIELLGVHSAISSSSLVLKRNDGPNNIIRYTGHSFFEQRRLGWENEQHQFFRGDAAYKKFFKQHSTIEIPFDEPMLIVAGVIEELLRMDLGCAVAFIYSSDQVKAKADPEILSMYYGNHLVIPIDERHLSHEQLFYMEEFAGHKAMAELFYGKVYQSVRSSCLKTDC